MTELSNDRATKFREMDRLELDVCADDIIYAGAAVAKDSSGDANPAANTSGFRFVGMADEQVDNTDGSAGDLTVKVNRIRCGLWAGSGLSVADVGKPCWFSDDKTITLTAGYCFAGRILAVESATEAWVDHTSAYSGINPQATIADVAAQTQTELTDNGGGTADGEVAAQAAPVAPTDSSGYDGTHDDVIAAMAAITELTDSTGQSGTHDDTLAATTLPVAPTDNTGLDGSHDDTLAAATPAAAITDDSGGVDPGDDTIAAIPELSAAAGMVTLTNVAAAAAAATQLDISAATGGESMANPVQPSHPRNITITFTDGNASISAFVVTVSGTAPDGTPITEEFSFAGGLAQTGSKVFATLTSVVLTSVTGNGAGDTLDAAWGVKLGVPVPYGSTGLSITKLSVDGVAEAAAATDTTHNSFTPTSAPNDTGDYEVWYEFTGPATTAIKAAVAQLAAKANTTRTAVGVLAQNICDLGQKAIEHNALLGVIIQNASDTAQKANELVARDAVTAQNICNLTQKVMELVTLATVAQNNLKEITTQLALIKADVAADKAKINALLASDEAAGVRLAS